MAPIAPDNRIGIVVLSVEEIELISYAVELVPEDEHVISVKLKLQVSLSLAKGYGHIPVTDEIQD